jgi:hypothetical protein
MTTNTDSGVTEGLVKNAEISAKENINSGITLTASPATLHHQLISVLCDSPSIPLDVFDKAEVIREERHCLPAYCFYCTGTASFTYEAGNIRQHKTVKDLGDKVVTEKENYMEWTQMSGSASATATLFVPGNKDFASQIKELYFLQDPKQLVDIEELVFPHDVVTYGYNLPQTASFNENAKSYMDKLLERNAEVSLKGKEFRGLTMGGSSIQKDEVVRVFLGLYRVVYKYDGKEYSLWATGDGKKTLYDGLPSDPQRQKVLDEKKESMKRALDSIPKPKTGLLNFFKVVCIILAALGLLVAFGGEGLGWGMVILFGAGAVLFGMIRSKKRKPYKTGRADLESKLQNEIDAFQAQVADTVRQFKSQKKALRGIYANVTGDASAF